LHKNERLPKETGREYALRNIKERIIQLQLEPGSMVSENELATELGISRTPMREALIELSKVKIVEIYPQRGCRVALIDHSMVEEANFMRLVLETAIVEELCTHEYADKLEPLQQNILLQEFYLNNNNPDKLLELDNEFHRHLFAVCNKLEIYQLMNGFLVHFDRVRSMSLTVVKDIKIVADHKSILTAVQNHDSQAARAMMEKHLSRYKVDEEEIRMKYPGYFK